jgi:hypothetical protein
LNVKKDPRPKLIVMYCVYSLYCVRPSKAPKRIMSWLMFALKTPVTLNDRYTSKMLMFFLAKSDLEMIHSSSGGN